MAKQLVLYLFLVLSSIGKFNQHKISFLMVYNMCRFHEKENSPTGWVTSWWSGSVIHNKKESPRLG